MALMAAFATVSFAADWTGKLIDATCAEQKKAACNATSTTTEFAIDVNGKAYKLDATGNSKAAAAIRDRADRSADPAKGLTATYTAKVTGNEKDGTIAVENLEVQ